MEVLLSKWDTLITLLPLRLRRFLVEVGLWKRGPSCQPHLINPVPLPEVVDNKAGTFINSHAQGLYKFEPGKKKSHYRLEKVGTKFCYYLESHWY